MDYTESVFRLDPLEPFREMLSFYLAEAGYEMFEDTDDGLKAYVRSDRYNATELQEIAEALQENGCTIRHTTQDVPWQNWNAEWESNFHPEVIGGKIYVRAEFHPANEQYPFEIVIQPKMAFGTGHHPTTAQVMALMTEIDFAGKSIIDMGCGTGILSILAHQLGAKAILAIDNDPVAVENCAENFRKNNVNTFVAITGEADSVGNYQADIVLANINRNIILQDIHFYSEWIVQGGLLFTSGYYEADLPAIRAAAEEHGLAFERNTVQNDWCCALFRKL